MHLELSGNDLVIKAESEKDVAELKWMMSKNKHLMITTLIGNACVPIKGDKIMDVLMITGDVR